MYDLLRVYAGISKTVLGIYMHLRSLQLFAMVRSNCKIVSFCYLFEIRNAGSYVRPVNLLGS